MLVQGDRHPRECVERDRLAEEYAALLDDDSRATFHELLGLSRTVFPYVEEHKFYCDYWFLTAWYNKVREFGALLARHGYLEETYFTWSYSPIPDDAGGVGGLFCAVTEVPFMV